MAEWGPFDVLDNLSPEDLRQRLLSLQAIIDRAPIPIAIAHDPDCRFIFANRALATLMGLPSDVNISLTPPAGERAQYRIQRDGKDIPVRELPMPAVRGAVNHGHHPPGGRCRAVQMPGDDHRVGVHHERGVGQQSIDLVGRGRVVQRVAQQVRVCGTPATVPRERTGQPGEDRPVGGAWTECRRAARGVTALEVIGQRFVEQPVQRGAPAIDVAAQVEAAALERVGNVDTARGPGTLGSEDRRARLDHPTRHHGVLTRHL